MHGAEARAVGPTQCARVGPGLGFNSVHAGLGPCARSDYFCALTLCWFGPWSSSVPWIWSGDQPCTIHPAHNPGRLVTAALGHFGIRLSQAMDKCYISSTKYAFGVQQNMNLQPFKLQGGREGGMEAGREGERVAGYPNNLPSFSKLVKSQDGTLLQDMSPT